MHHGLPSITVLLVGLWVSQGTSAHAQNVTEVSLVSGETCLPPDDPYPYKLPKSDPLYDTARDEHQEHLESLEKYVNCLDRERGAALDQLRSSFNLFLNNFGEDAVLRYGAERKARE